MRSTCALKYGSIIKRRKRGETRTKGVGDSVEYEAINCFHHRNGTWICNFLNDTCHVKGIGEERGKVDF